MSSQRKQTGAVAHKSPLWWELRERLRDKAPRFVRAMEKSGELKAYLDMTVESGLEARDWMMHGVRHDDLNGRQMVMEHVWDQMLEVPAEYDDRFQGASDMPIEMVDFIAMWLKNNAPVTEAPLEEPGPGLGNTTGNDCE